MSEATPKREREETTTPPPPPKKTRVGSEVEDTGLHELARSAIDTMNGQVKENFYEKWTDSYLEDLMDEWNEVCPEGDDQVEDMDKYEIVFQDAILAACKEALECILFDEDFRPNASTPRYDDPAYSVEKVGSRKHHEAKVFDAILWSMWDSFVENDVEVEDEDLDEDEEDYEVIGYLQGYLKQNPRFQDDVIRRIMNNWKNMFITTWGAPLKKSEE